MVSMAITNTKKPDHIHQVPIVSICVSTFKKGGRYAVASVVLVAA